LGDNPQSRALYGVDLMLSWETNGSATTMQPQVLEFNFNPGNWAVGEVLLSHCLIYVIRYQPRLQVPSKLLQRLLHSIVFRRRQCIARHSAVIASSFKFMVPLLKQQAPNDAMLRNNYLISDISNAMARPKCYYDRVM
jgi:hypothetical protein